MEGIQQAQGQDGHVGYAVFKATGKEGVEAPEDHDQFAAVRFTAEAAPDGQADQDVTENAFEEEYQRRQVHLHGSGIGQGLTGAASRAGSTVENQGQDDGAEPVAQVADDPQADDVRQSDRLRTPAVVEDEGIAREQFCPGDDDQTQGDAKGQAHGDLRHRNSTEGTADGKGQEDAEADVGAG